MTVNFSVNNKHSVESENELSKDDIIAKLRLENKRLRKMNRNLVKTAMAMAIKAKGGSSK